MLVWKVSNRNSLQASRWRGIESKYGFVGRNGFAGSYKISYNTCHMTKLKIRTVGDSLGVILPKSVLQRLSVSEGDEIFLTEAPGGGYRLTAKTPEFEAQVKNAYDLIKRYRDALDELAKH